MILSALLLRSSNIQPIVCCAIGVCVGIYLFFHGFHLLQRRRLILDTPFSKIRSAAMGMVEVSGLAVGPYLMTAPITARPCYYYRTLVWEWKREGRSSTWVKVAAESMHLPFFLDDNTGRVLVDPRGAELDLHRDFQQEFCDSFFTIKDPAPDNVRTFLARHGIVTSNKIKIEEFCIKPKNALFVLGTLGDNPGLEVSAEPVLDAEATSFLPGNILSFSLGGSSFSFGGGGMTEATTALTFPPSSQEVIRLSTASGGTKAADMSQQEKISAALMKAGILTPAAWAAAGATGSATEVSKANGADAGQPNGSEVRPPVVLMKGTNDKTFLISWRSQQDIARSLGWKCAAYDLGRAAARPALPLLAA